MNSDKFSAPINCESLTLRPFDPTSESDRLRSAELMRVVWGNSDYCDPRYIRWQYLDNPAGHALGFVFEDHRGSFASQYMAIPAVFAHNKQETKGLLSVNTATRNEYRGKGLFVQGAQATYAKAQSLGFHGVFGAPNDSSLPGFKKLGFSQLASLRIAVGTPRPLKLMCGFPTLYRERHFPKFSELSIDVPEFSVAALAQLLDAPRYGDDSSRQVAGSGLTTVKSKSWLRWRYQDHPTRKYLSLRSESGAVILRSFVLGDTPVAVIVDILGAPSHSDYKHWKATLKANGVAFIASVHSPQWMSRVSKLAPLSIPSFVAPKAFHVIWKTLAGASSPTSHAITLGDIDLY